MKKALISVSLGILFVLSAHAEDKRRMCDELGIDDGVSSFAVSGSDGEDPRASELLQGSKSLTLFTRPLGAQGGFREISGAKIDVLLRTELEPDVYAVKLSISSPETMSRNGFPGGNRSQVTVWTICGAAH